MNKYIEGADRISPYWRLPLETRELYEPKGCTQSLQTEPSPYGVLAG